MNQQLIDFGIDLTKLLEYFGVQLIYPRGPVLRCLCPFHEEKTPSFDFHTEQGIFHCFGCGIKGNIISFVKFKKACSFYEACEWLMQFCGLAGDPEKFLHTLEQYGDSNQFIRSIKSFEVFQAQNEIHDEQTIQSLSKNRREFYFNKGFSDEILDEFEVGYALDPHVI